MKRFTIAGYCLVAMLALSGLAISPVGAQAEAPRWLQNGTEAKLEEGKLLPILSWGLVTFENTKFGLIKCQTSWAGVATDPGKAGLTDVAGEAKVQSYTVYNCHWQICENVAGRAEVTPLGNAENELKEKITVERITTPWEALLTEPTAGAFHLTMGTKTGETAIRLRFMCAALPAKAEFSGQLTPSLESGALIGAAPSKLEFKGEESGHLEGSEGFLNFNGKNKLQGYESQELLTVKRQ
jgi:hypothetical protein